MKKHKRYLYIATAAVIILFLCTRYKTREQFESDGVNTKVDLSSFDERQQSQLAEYYNKAVEEAKSQLTQPEKGDQGPQGLQGPRGEAGGTVIRNGRLTAQSAAENGALDVEISSIDPRTKLRLPIPRMILAMNQFNKSPSQDWIFLTSNQIQNKQSLQCLMSDQLGNLVFDKCVDTEQKNPGSDDPITPPQTMTWNFNKCGQMVWDGNQTNRKCLSFAGGLVQLEDCKLNEECQGVPTQQVWWWGG